MTRYNLIAILVACASPVLAYAAVRGPSTEVAPTLDRSLDRQTERGRFQVRIGSATPVPLHRIHRWTVQVTDEAGRPVPDAAIRVGGGMPQHGHGLPTSPTATAGGAAGSYLINGMKFSMDGWWELTLDIAAGGITDRVTFNIVL